METKCFEAPQLRPGLTSDLTILVLPMIFIGIVLGRWQGPVTFCVLTALIQTSTVSVPNYKSF
jgi:hypothetical protein